MNSRVLGLAAIAVMTTVILLQSTTEPPVETELVIPSLADSIDEVSGLRIEDLAEQNAIELQKTDDGWLLTSSGDYPAEDSTITQLLLDLKALEIAERKTAKPEYHERLGLASNGLELMLEPQGVGIIFGNIGPSGGRFIRFSGEDQTYLTRQSLEIGADSMEWVDSLILNIPANEVSSVRVARQDGKLLQGSVSEEGWQVDGLPADRDLQYPTVLDSLGRILLNVRILDVATYDTSLFEDSNEITVTLVSGETLQVNTVQHEGEFWLHTEFDGKGGWQHKISEFTYNELTKEMEDLLKDREVTES